MLLLRNFDKSKVFANVTVVLLDKLLNNPIRNVSYFSSISSPRFSGKTLASDCYSSSL